MVKIRVLWPFALLSVLFSARFAYPQEVMVTVSPTTASVPAGATLPITAKVTNAANTSVTWSIDGVKGGNATVGTITPAGLYTAPSTVPIPPVIGVMATSNADSRKTATAILTITAAPPVVVSVSPTVASVPMGATLPVTATVTNAVDTSVTWSVDGMNGGNPMVGRIDLAGVYTAPSTVPNPAAVSVTATSNADPKKTASALVTITAAPAAQTQPTPSPGPAPPAGRTPGATLSAITLSFGYLSVGNESPAQTLTLTNSGSSTLNITNIQITGTNAKDFRLTANTCGPALSASAKCTISVTFAPNAVKKRAGEVTITYNAPGGTQTLPLTGEGTGFEKFYYETLAGLDLTATSTSGPGQQYFADVSLLRSVGCKAGSVKLKYDKCWLWFTGKIASVPSAQTAALSTLSSLSTSVPGLNQKTLGDITQSLEIHGGFEYALTKAFNKKPALISLIGGAGAVSPFSASSGSPEFDLTQSGSSTSYLVQQFNATPSFATQYPQLACALTAYGYTDPNSGCTKPSPAPLHVAFVLPNRSRFYREYSAGVRIRGFLADMKTYPITFDVRIGQDETVTAGHLYGWVTTISGDSPIPGAPWLRVFGSAYLRLARNVNSPGLVLLPTQIPVALSDPSVVLQGSQPADQDYFRLGFGIDLFTAFKAATAKASTTPAGTTP